MTGYPSIHHADEIERVLDGKRSHRDPAVTKSWIRCVSEYRMDPAQKQRAHIVSESRLREHRDRSERLIHIARNGLSDLFRQVAGHDYVLLLADNKGVTVDYFGDRKFEADLRKAGLYLGSEWSEARAGTCGVGSCIATGEALTIHQNDHFDEQHTPLSCTAAPIYDPSGSLAAVLDISLLRPPGPKISQNLALHLVRLSVRHIELANLMHEQRRGWVLCFSRQSAFLDVDPEHAIAIDASGLLVGMTHSACCELAAITGSSWREPQNLLGSPIGHFFQTDTKQLSRLIRAREPDQRMLLAADGSRWYARLQDPDWSPAQQGISMLQTQPPTNKLKKRANQSSAFAGLHLGDHSVEKIVRQCSRIAATDLAVLIQGETGSGKERLARAIHKASGRQGEFVALNCAAIPESLIEGELFGHAPSAFTGAASKGRAGLVEAANGGTLFLDEIGDMPLALQGRLLRVLSEGEVMRLGATQTITLDIRVISATLHNLESRVISNQFRNDLYHRLAGAEFWLPRLCDRNDFSALTLHLLQSHNASLELSRNVEQLLASYSWPGNIRELNTALRYATLQCEGHIITDEHLPERLIRKRPLKHNLEKDRHHELSELSRVVEQCDGNISEAARRLGVDRSTVYRRMRRLEKENAC